MTEDIQDLLSSLDESKPVETHKVAEPVSADPPVPAAPDITVLEPELLPAQTESATPAVTVAMSPEHGIAIQTPADDRTEQFFNRYNEVFSEILDGARHDRQEAQDAIDLCRRVVKQYADTNSRDLPRVYLEMMVKAIETKANINTNVVKGLDAGAKILAASKAKLSVNQNNVNMPAEQGGEEEDLNALLDES